MTQITIKRAYQTIPDCGKTQDALQLDVTGHAGYGANGKDLVCAAESILVQAFSAFLAGANKRDLYHFSVEGIEGRGSVSLCAVPTKGGWDYIRGAFECVVMGFYLLSRRYPNHVNVRVIKQEEV
ncbi:MAG: ribosomal-processing cysteine protease Prp [Faecalibacterium sp.]